MLDIRIEINGHVIIKLKGARKKCWNNLNFLWAMWVLI